MFVIGVDPHKGSHTAAALSSTEEVIAEVRADADAKQLERLLEWAEAFSPRRWAVEGAGGTGALLARQLVAAGEEVLDVAPTLSARVRLLDRGRSAKTDAHDPGPPPSWPCATPTCAAVLSRTMTPCCACWPIATTTWWPSAPGWCAGSTPCWSNSEKGCQKRAFS